MATDSPEDVLRRFLCANLTDDEAAIRALIIDHPDAAILWEGTYPEDVAAMLREQYLTMEIVRIDDPTNRDHIRLRSTATPVPMSLRRLNGQWRVDVSSIIDFRKRVEERRREGTAAAPPSRTTDGKPRWVRVYHRRVRRPGEQGEAD